MATGLNVLDSDPLRLTRLAWATFIVRRTPRFLAIGTLLFSVLLPRASADVAPLFIDPQAIIDDVSLRESGFNVSPAQLNGISLYSRISPTSASGQFTNYLHTSVSDLIASESDQKPKSPFSLIANFDAGYDSNPSFVTSNLDAAGAGADVTAAYRFLQNDPNQFITLGYEIGGKFFDGSLNKADKLNHTFDARFARSLSEFFDFGLDAQGVISTQNFDFTSTTVEATPSLTWRPTGAGSDFSFQPSYVFDRNRFHQSQTVAQDPDANRHALNITGAYAFPPENHAVQGELDFTYSQIWNDASGAFQKFTSEQIVFAAKGFRPLYIFTAIANDKLKSRLSADFAFNFAWRDFEHAGTRSGNVEAWTTKVTYNLRDDGTAAIYALYTLTAKHFRSGTGNSSDQAAVVGLILKF